MFRKILIANRGEIAVRIARTARDLGVKTVAVFSDADRDALHVEMADEAVHIGASPPAESYLRGDRIIEAALATGAEAIHPGYGFLSENPDFVDAVGAAGLTFIGPSAEAIRAMGLKDAAKLLMEKAGVPVVPGYHGADQDPGHLEVEAAAIGYPVLIKAVAGGGGKGMRLVEKASEFMDALDAAKSEAMGAFGNDAVLIEKFVEKPRHIEVQVFGDGKHAVHLFERDCSLQRRHQKVIEEAPAPGMTEEMRAAMGQAAVRAAEAINYAGAGTIEFIVDASRGLRPDGFYFMEMNTRLQVEHPVTEAITGIDLVEWQLRVAAGESLPKSQDQIELNGHSIEVRLYAEDAENGFLPVTGVIQYLDFPDKCRTDTGVRTGDEISQFYDPMIAKLIVFAESRDAALSAMDRTLGKTVVAGTVTNRTFLQNLVENVEFRSGNVDTGLIARELDTLVESPHPTDEEIAAAAVFASGLCEDCGDLTGFALWQPLQHRVALRSKWSEYNVIIAITGRKSAVVDVGARALDVDWSSGWRVDGRKVDIELRAIGRTVAILSPRATELMLDDPLEREAEDIGTSGSILAPMPGLVRSVLVSAGDTVTAGTRLVILEAMKMEHVLSASEDGVVAEVLASVGDQVAAGDVIVRMED